MGYQKFKKPSIGQLEVPTISITKSGAFNLNEQCMTQYFGDCAFVELYYDDDSKKMGIMPVENKTHHTFTLTKKKNTRYATIHGKSFIQHYGLGVDVRTLHLAVWDEEAGLIEVDTQKVIDPKTFDIEEYKNKKPQPKPSKKGVAL